MKKWVGNWWEKVRTDPWVALLISLLTVLSLIFLTVVIRDDPDWIYPYLGVGATTGEKSEALKLLGIGMGGLLLALQALMSYKRAKALEDNVETTERGQRQERLKNAIEHLGHKSDSVRLGGAYELFHLAEDAEDVGQRQTVLDILCAHIRWTTGEPEYRDKHQSKPSEEIQSLLTLLFVQEHQVFTERDIKLQGSWLTGSNLSQARLENAHLEGAHLRGAHLREAQLRGAHLEGAQLHGADLVYAQLHGAHLTGAELHGADLVGAELQGAHLAGAELHGAHLAGAELHGAILMSAQLHGADLVYAQLHEVDLEDAELHGASSSRGRLHKPFEAAINERIGKESDLSRAIFAGGLTQKNIALIGTGLSDKAAKELRGKLAEHIGKPISHELPENSGAIPGTYTEEEAAQWIAEYQIPPKARI